MAQLWQWPGAMAVCLFGVSLALYCFVRLEGITGIHICSLVLNLVKVTDHYTTLVAVTFWCLNRAFWCGHRMRICGKIWCQSLWHLSKVLYETAIITIVLCDKILKEYAEKDMTLVYCHFWLDYSEGRKNTKSFIILFSCALVSFSFVFFCVCEW